MQAPSENWTLRLGPIFSLRVAIIVVGGLDVIFHVVRRHLRLFYASGLKIFFLR